eukprot:Clim_evm235s157 gene=Clim_evmTU235s157
MSLFGELVVGPPGSGKTTYCKAMCRMLDEIGRITVLVNLDPANDLEIVSDRNDRFIDICELVTLEDAMEEHHLGPNGGLLLCMDIIETNIDWLIGRIRDCAENFRKDGLSPYFVFDCPGQVELYIHHQSFKKIVSALENEFKLCAVNVVDGTLLRSPQAFISLMATSLALMINLELPQVHVLSKIDIVRTATDMPLAIEDCLDPEGFLNALSRSSYSLDRERNRRYAALDGAMIELVNDYGLLGFQMLSVREPETLVEVQKAIDAANGYYYGDLEHVDLETVAQILKNTE